MAGYRVKVLWTYSTTTAATSCVTAINNVLASYPNVTGGPATRSGSAVNCSLICPDKDVDALRIALAAAWAGAGGTRSGGLACAERIGDT